nr:hypothetical protein [Candidatus Sigynarchaeota archaeon]
MDTRASHWRTLPIVMACSIVLLAGITLVPGNQHAAVNPTRPGSTRAIGISTLATTYTAWTKYSRVPAWNKTVFMSMQGSDIYLLTQDKAFLHYNTAGDLLTNTTAAVQGVPNDLVVNGTSYYIAGTHLDKAYLAKYWLNGTLQWQRWHNDSTYNYGRKAVIGGNDVYWLGGQGNTTSNTDGFITRFNSAGAAAWHTNWGYDFIDEVFVNGIVHNNRLYAIEGDSASSNLVKFDLNGNNVFNGTFYLGDGKDHGNEIIEYSGFIYTAGDGTFMGIDDNVYLEKYTEAMTSPWGEEWGGTNDERIGGLAVVNDTLIVTGSTTSFGVPAQSMLIAAFNMSGSFLWKKIWTGPTSSRACGIQAGPGNTFFVAGEALNGTTPTTFLSLEVPNTPPAVDAPADITGMDHDPLAITWTATDNSTATANYTMYINGSQDSSGLWTSGAPIVKIVPSTTIGSYNCTIIVNDGFGLTASDTVITNVTNHPPVIYRTPANMSYEYSTTGHNMTWSVRDYTAILSPTYEAFIDGARVANSTWTNNSAIWPSGAIWVQVDSLGIGLHNVSIQFHDGIGGITESRASVTVYNLDPVLTFSHLNLHAWNATSPSYFHDIVITDTSTGAARYTLFINGTNFTSGTWSSGVPFGIQLGTLAVGIYNFTLAVSDGFGG